MILIVGGTGYIESHITKKIYEQGYSVKQVIKTIEKDKFYTTFNWKPEYTSLEKSIKIAWDWFKRSRYA